MIAFLPSLFSDRIKTTLLAGVAALISLLFLTALPSLYRDSGAVIEIDMSVSDGGTMEVYLNDLTREPRRVTLISGQRTVYRIDGVLEDIGLLRLDPGYVPGAVIEIYGIRITDWGQLYRSFSPAEIARWTTWNVGKPVLGDGFVRFVAASNDPILQTTPAIVFGRSNSFLLTGLVVGLNKAKNAMYIVLATFVFSLLFGLASPQRRWHLPLAGLAVLGGWVAMKIVTQYYQPLGPVDISIGRAGFLGFSTSGLRMSILAAVAVAATVGIAGYLVHRRIGFWLENRENGTGAALASGGGAINVWHVVVAIAIGLVVALAFMPDLRAWLGAMSQRTFATDWDSNNVIAWDFLSFSGYLPFRDFWYPYSGFFLFSLMPPYGVIATFLYKSLVYGLVLLPLYRLLGYRLLLIVLLLPALWIGEVQQVFWGAYRYLLAVAIMLNYVSIARERQKLQFGHGLFWLAVCLGLFFEPAQIIYAAPAVAAILVLDVVQGRPWAPRLLAARLLREFLVPALFLGLLLAGAAATGQLAGMVDFYRGLTAASNASATPNDMLAALSSWFGIKAANLFLPLIFTAIGLFERLKAARRGSIAGDLMLGLGLVGFMMMQKHLVRPTDWQMFLVPALGVFVYAATWRMRRPSIEYVGLGLLAGAYIAVMVNTGGLTNFKNAVVQGPANFLDGLNVLLKENALIEEARDQAFDDDRFRDDDAKAVLAGLAARTPGGEIPTFYVLGDSPFFYVLANRVPPYHVNDYNAAPLLEQVKVEAYIRREKPQYAIWNPDTLIMDGIQNFVRNPTIYNAVIESYIPDFSVNRYQVLRRRPADAPVAMEYWREKLGSSARLGAIARQSSFDRFGKCRKTQKRCREFLRLEVTDWRGLGQMLTVPVVSGGYEFGIEIQLSRQVSVYHISLNRLWFWEIAKRHGGDPKISYEKLPPGVKIGILRREPRPDILY